MNFFKSVRPALIIAKTFILSFFRCEDKVEKSGPDLIGCIHGPFELEATSFFPLQTVLISRKVQYMCGIFPDLIQQLNRRLQMPHFMVKQS
jgi:hypothetical protein